jgi:hypothetical protein
VRSPRGSRDLLHLRRVGLDAQQRRSTSVWNETFSPSVRASSEVSPPSTSAQVHDAPLHHLVAAEDEQLAREPRARSAAFSISMASERSGSSSSMPSIRKRA